MLPSRYCYFLSLLLTFVQCQSTSKQCYSVPLFENFDIEKVAKVWYPQQVGYEREARKKCLFYILGVDTGKDETVLIVHQIWKNNTSRFTSKQINNTSAFRTEWENITRNAWLISTDYTSYSTWYICIPGPTKTTHILHISTIARNPNEATIKKAQDSIREANSKFSTIKLFPVDRSGCDN